MIECRPAETSSEARKIPTSPAPNVHQLIEQAALSNPGGAALRHGERTLAKAELIAWARALAGQLLDRGVAPGSVVAVRLDRSFAQIVAGLAILYAGSAFMNIDPADPAERANRLIQAGGAAAVITDRLRAVDHDGLVIAIGDDRFRTDEAPQRALPAVGGDDLAYIIHTSGSTGVPNGVEITHASLLHLIEWTNRAFSITTRDRTSHAHGLGFDAVIWELWPALAAGATIHIIDDVVRTSPELLRDALIEQRIDVAFAPTVLAEPLIALDWPMEAPLRFLLTGGDVLRAYPRKPLPFALVNNYGPAECTVQTTWGVVPVRAGERPDALPSIGRPIDGVFVYILDEHQQPVAPGGEGDIWIGGKSVGRGYRNRPELTAQKFRTDPFSPVPGARMYRTGDRGRWIANGEIAFCGRGDRQVKIGGIRIELDEIALALQRHPRVGSALVDAIELPERGKVLAAYVVPRAREMPPAPLDLRRFLYRTLPRNFIPTIFTILDAMPLTRNGKVDRTRLPRPELPTAGTAPDAQPLSLLETRVVEIMREALALDTLGLDDNFFLLGGHSLVATRVIVRCRELLGVPIALRDLFEADSIREFVDAIHHRLAAQVLARTEQRASAAVDASSWA